MSGDLPTVDRDAERAVLGAALASPEAADEIMVILEARDFYFPQNKLIFQAISDLSSEGKEADGPAVLFALKDRGEYDRVGGSPYLTEVMQSPQVRKLEDAARRVLELAMVRRAAEVFQRLERETREPIEDRREWLQAAEAAVYEATGSHALEERPAALMSDIAPELLRHVEACAGSPDRSGKRTGFEAIDDHIGGMGRGDLWIIGGRPGMGKTSFADQVAHYRATLGDLVVSFNLEMPREQMAMRIAARLGRIPLRRLRSSTLDAGEWNRLTSAVKEMGPLPWVIDDTPDLTPAKLRSKLRRHVSLARKKHPNALLGLVVVDYLQLMSAGVQAGTRAEAVGHISRALKLTARAFNVPLIGLSQLTRPPKDKRTHRPQMDDLRESGSIEQDADGILLLHNPDKYTTDEQSKHGECEVIVAKGRNCGEGIHNLKFEGRYTEFSDLAA